MVNSIDDQRINTVNETPIKQMAHGNAARIIPFLREKFGRSLALFSIFRDISVLLKCQWGPGLKQHFPIIFQSQQPLSYLRKIIVNSWNQGIFLGLGSLNQERYIIHGIIGIIMCSIEDPRSCEMNMFFWTVRILESYLIFKNFLNLEFFPNIEPLHIDFAFDH